MSDINNNKENDDDNVFIFSTLKDSLGKYTPRNPKQLFTITSTMVSTVNTHSSFDDRDLAIGTHGLFDDRDLTIGTHGSFDDRDLAIRGIEELVREQNDEWAGDPLHKDETWMCTGKRDVYVRVKRDIASKRKFSRISKDPRLFEIKFAIDTSFYLNKVKPRFS